MDYPTPTTLEATLATIDAIEADFRSSFAEMRLHAHAVFAAKTDDGRAAAVKAGCDFAYELLADCAPFDALAELWGIEEEGIGRESSESADD